MYPGNDVDSIRLAMLTVSPSRTNLGVVTVAGVMSKQGTTSHIITRNNSVIMQPDQ